MKWILLLSILLTSKTMAFDHSHLEWQVILEEVVKKESSQALVNYKGLKKDQKKLKKYLESLSSVKKAEYNSWDKSKRLSFLINAYNAFTMELIINEFPLKSIRDAASLFSSPWKREFFTLLEKKHHLDWIEHDMIRKKFKEPRIHFALVCASLGCPNIQKKAFNHENLDKLLDLSARDFLGDKKKNYFDGEKLHLSKIFKWYGEDFPNLKKYISTYLTNDLKLQKKIQNPKTKINWLFYNWGLNEWK